MHYIGKQMLFVLASLPFLLLTLAVPVFAVDPRFDLDTRLLDSKAETARKSAPVQHSEKNRPGRQASGLTRYTVKPGDTFYLILMGAYGLSEKEADAIIPRVKELNGITNIKALRVGSTISIPLAQSGARARPARVRQKGDSPVAVAQQFSLQKQLRTDTVNDFSAVRGVWDQLMPSSLSGGEGIHVTGQNFELALDAGRFPVLPAADGGRLLIDPGGALPPLVKTLVQSIDTVRVVNESPSNVRRFYSALLSEARFFSVAEDFSVDFGSDPQLTVSSDFKIETTHESLMKQELVLLNVTEARSATPPVLASFLARQGFRLIEPYPEKRRAYAEDGHRIHRITGVNASEIADRLLGSLNLRYSRDARVEMFGPNDSGLKLDIIADRYFEVDGERFIISRFNGDPVFYTLMRLLETRGYRLIILEDRDDFRTVAEKLLSRMKMPARFDSHRLWPAHDLPYSVKLSGFMLKDPESGKKVVLTSAGINPLISELVTLNGFTVFPSQ